jgi:hypothetical protein
MQFIEIDLSNNETKAEEMVPDSFIESLNTALEE